MKSRSHIRRRAISTGFTLIELLVVISIISTLASIIFATFSVTKAQAKNGRIITEVQQLRNQIETGWNGSSYSDFTSYAPDTSGAYVAPNTFTPTSNVGRFIADITATNGGSYGGGSASTGTYCTSTGGGSTYTYYPVNINYMSGGQTTNGITIYVWPACKPVTQYAICASFVPLTKIGDAFDINKAYASVGLPPDPSTLPGYYCLDSSGNALTSTSGWMPGNITTGALR